MTSLHANPAIDWSKKRNDVIDASSHKLRLVFMHVHSSDWTAATFTFEWPSWSKQQNKTLNWLVDFNNFLLLFVRIARTQHGWRHRLLPPHTFSFLGHRYPIYFFHIDCSVEEMSQRRGAQKRACNWGVQIIRSSYKNSFDCKFFSHEFAHR